VRDVASAGQFRFGALLACATFLGGPAATDQGGFDADAALPSPPPRQAAGECDSPRTEWIWCDDFESNRLGSYFEYDRAGGRFQRVSGAGVGGGYAMRATWSPGQVSVGSLHLAFGRTPASSIRPVDAGVRDYRGVYWRIYLKNDSGWVGGGGNKLSRAQILANTNWAQAMVAPVWSGTQPGARIRLMLDPASGTDAAGNLRATKYNDESNFRFLGAASAATPIFAPAAVGRWYCIEARVQLNDPGAANGVFELWIDEVPQASRTGLNWVGTYSAHGINTVFLENYWNEGSPRAQARAIDQFVVSTDRIGCR
jgi:hypothetical protein